jgi:hypothetical protein
VQPNNCGRNERAKQKNKTICDVQNSLQLVDGSVWKAGELEVAAVDWGDDEDDEDDESQPQKSGNVLLNKTVCLTPVAKIIQLRSLITSAMICPRVSSESNRIQKSRTSPTGRMVSGPAASDSDRVRRPAREPNRAISDLSPFGCCHRDARHAAILSA